MVETMQNRLMKRVGDIIMILIGIIFLIPFVWIIVSALTKHATMAVSFTNQFTFGNFAGALTSKSNLQSFGNSLYLAGGTMLLTTVIAMMAAYPLSRYKQKFQQILLYSMIFASGLPVVALMIPVYDFYVQYNLIDSRLWTVMFMAATALPFATWIMKGFVDAVPLELEESSWVEGANTIRSFIQVVVPLILPGAGVVAVYTFVNAWGDFIIPFILLQPPVTPASVSIDQFFGQYGINYGGLAAFALLYTIPPVVLYVIVSRRTGSGFSLGGAVKG